MLLIFMLIRPAIPSDALRVAELHLTSWQTALRGLARDDFLDHLSIERFHRGWTDTITQEPGDALVAEDETGVVQGYSIMGRRNSESSLPLEYDGQIYGIVVGESEQGRGVGYLLMQASFERLASLGYANAHLWTFVGNLRASQFFERIGGRIVGRAMKNFGGRNLVDIAYGWDKLDLPPRTTP